MMNLHERKQSMHWTKGMRSCMGLRELDEVEAFAAHFGFHPPSMGTTMTS